MTTVAAPMDVLLRNGQLAQVRTLHASDENGLRALNARVSLRTRFRRYFSPSDVSGDWYVDRLMATARDEQALVALVHGDLVAVASFVRLERDPHAAELAVLVDDQHQGEGIGALLLEHLADVARRRGVLRFSADVLLENGPMRHLLSASGFGTRTVDVSSGVCELSVDLADTADLRRAVHHREAEAEAASLQHLLAPRSVAVVGSRRPGSVADRVHGALLGSYRGQLHRIGAGHGLLELPDPVDLVVLAVPAAHALEAAADAARNGARGLLVLSADFAEAGPEGRERQRALVALCREHDMRLIGPNCLGIVSTDPALNLNATFCDAAPRPGRVALVSQSGAVGIAALRHAERRGTGLSMFVSTGNKADVSGNDLLCYLEDDPRTTVIALYLESFGNAQKFVRIASAVGRRKPIVVLKSGRSEAGARAGQSHTAAAASPDAAIDALLREAGVLRATDLPELFDVISVLEAAPLPRGHRVAIIGNSGGPGVLAADACATAGLVVAELEPQTKAALAELVPAAGSATNPVDLLATVDTQTYEAAVTAVLNDPGVDAVVAIYTPLLRDAEEQYAEALAAAHRSVPGKTLLAAFPGVLTTPAALLDLDGRSLMPTFEFPEPAVRALGLVCEHAAWARRSKQLPAVTSVSSLVLGQQLLDHAPEDGWLTPTQVATLLQAYAIPTARLRQVSTSAEAVAAADALGYPVALKAVGPGLLHKSDLGGVVLDVADEAALTEAYQQLSTRLGERMSGAVVQEMHRATDGLELLLGVTVDPQAGPLVLAAAGGVDTDLLGDRVLRMPASSTTAAIEQLAALRCARRFGGFRGRPALDLDAAAQAVVALGAMARDLPQLQELDLNPVLVSADGICCLDARIRLGAPASAVGVTTRSLAPASRSTPEPGR